MSFDFSFASTLGSAQRDRCQTSLPVDVRAAIDDNSTIDLSGYHHYIAMPDLRAFARSGFPFSRMADLSETLVIMPAKPTAMQVGTLLDAVGGLAGQIGYPALGLKLVDDWKQATAADADLLLIGSLPEALSDAPNLGLLLSAQRDWLLQGRSAGLPGSQRFDTAPGQLPTAAEVSRVFAANLLLQFGGREAALLKAAPDDPALWGGSENRFADMILRHGLGDPVDVEALHRIGGGLERGLEGVAPGGESLHGLPALHIARDHRLLRHAAAAAARWTADNPTAWGASGLSAPATAAPPRAGWCP